MKLKDKGRLIFNKLFESYKWVQDFKIGLGESGFCDPYFNHWVNWKICTSHARTLLSPEVRCPTSKFKKCEFRKLVEEIKKKDHPEYFDIPESEWKKSTITKKSDEEKLVVKLLEDGLK